MKVDDRITLLNQLMAAASQLDCLQNIFDELDGQQWSPDKGLHRRLCNTLASCSARYRWIHPGHPPGRRSGWR